VEEVLTLKKREVEQEATIWEEEEKMVAECTVEVKEVIAQVLSLQQRVVEKVATVAGEEEKDRTMVQLEAFVLPLHPRWYQHLLNEVKVATMGLVEERDTTRVW